MPTHGTEMDLHRADAAAGCALEVHNTSSESEDGSDWALVGVSSQRVAVEQMDRLLQGLREGYPPTAMHPSKTWRVLEVEG